MIEYLYSKRYKNEKILGDDGNGKNERDNNYNRRYTKKVYF